MSRLTAISLVGFKGVTRTYTLEAATLLNGPNGAGKSAALEGIIYALSGKVPSGRSLDCVAAYFPPRGGHVQLHDADGRWIRRGITRDAEKAKVSELLEVSDAKEGEKPDFSPWAAREAVLDLSEFLALSPAKRREYVLALCGSGAALDPAMFMSALELEFCRELAGPTATPDALDKPENLPDEINAAWTAWGGELGLGETLASHLVAGRGVSEIALKLGQVAKERRLGCRQAAIDARSGMRELEVEAKGAAAGAANIAGSEAVTAALHARLVEAKGRLERAREAKSAYDTAQEQLKAALVAHAGAKDALAALGLAPVRPPAPPRDEAVALAMATYANTRDAAHVAEAAHLAALQGLTALDKAWKEVERLEAELKALESSEMGLVVSIVAQIPDAAHAEMRHLRAAIDRVAVAWRATVCMTKVGLNAARKSLEACSAEDPRAIANETHELLAACLAASKVAAGQLDAVDIAAKNMEDAHEKARAEFAAADKPWQAAKRKLEAAEVALAAARKAADLAATRHLDARDEAPEESALAELAAKIEVAKAREAQARKAAGAVAAFESAKARLLSNQVEEAAWKLAEKALATVREKLVGQATEPLMGVLMEFLAGAGRTEFPYLELENDRGKPIFELGWIRGDERIPLDALSAGEAAIFGAALSVAIAMHSSGLRVLLAEADPLDEKNLLAFLAAVAPWADRLDACLIATAQAVPGQIKGWTIVRLGANG